MISEHSTQAGNLIQFGSGIWPGTEERLEASLFDFDSRYRDHKWGVHGLTFALLLGLPRVAHGSWRLIMVYASGTQWKRTSDAAGNPPPGGWPYADVRVRHLALEGFRVELVHGLEHGGALQEYLSLLWEHLRHDGLAPLLPDKRIEPPKRATATKKAKRQARVAELCANYTAEEISEILERENFKGPSVANVNRDLRALGKVAAREK